MERGPRQSESRRRGLGQQAGSHRLGGVAALEKIHRQGIVSGGIGTGWPAHDPLIDRRCLRVVKTRWPDSRTVFWKPGLKNGARRREFYEDRNARISILARGLDPRSDTLKQTDRSALSIKSLADGAGHTFFKACCASRSLCGCTGRPDMLLKFSFFSSLPTLRSCR